MAEYALVGPDNVIIRWATDAEISPDVQTRAGWRWLPVETTNPPYNSATDIRTGPVVAVGPERVTRVWSVRRMTPEELAKAEEDAKERKLNEVDVLIFRILFNHENRVRVLEGKAAVTAEQFRAAMKALL